MQKYLAKLNGTSILCFQFLYVNQAFAPAPDMEVGTVFDVSALVCLFLPFYINKGHVFKTAVKIFTLKLNF